MVSDPSPSRPSFYAPAPRGLAPLLEAELRDLGVRDPHLSGNGVRFTGPLRLAYRVCLWSRVASRVLLELWRVPAADPEELCAAVRALPWEDHLPPGGSLAVTFHARDPAFPHARFGAQRVKDAVVDRWRDRRGSRPRVRREHPDLRIHVFVREGRADVGIDLAGEGLHRRGYRRETVAAPLRENLAAGVLLRAGWPELAAEGRPLVDPFCGSGTLLVEAALLAGDAAPGLLRPRHGFEGWLGHDAEAWKDLLSEARARRAAGRSRIPPILGSDRDPAAVRAARANAAAAGLEECIRIERRDFEEVVPPPGDPGLLAANPPWGRRLSSREELADLYGRLGDLLKRSFRGWRAAILAGDPELGKRMGLRARRIHRLWNGARECRLLHFRVEPRWFVSRASRPLDPEVARARKLRGGSPGAAMLGNRLRKNLRILGRWARRAGFDAFRLYDRDVPEYAFAVDLYRGRDTWVLVQEYAPPPEVDPETAAARRSEALAAILDLPEVDPSRVVYRLRRRGHGGGRYGRFGEGGSRFPVREGDLRFLVNLTDRLDTGLFLDQRPTRALIRELAAGRRFLNLFGYTGTATVAAAAGGAARTTTVDLSRTYLEWASENLALNGFSGERHRLVRADCLAWLARPARERYDLIFLDPPTFSSSRRMRGSFEVNRDHGELIRGALRLLAPGGLVLFSTNVRRFRLDREALGDLEIEDITRATIPRDFARNPRVHRCFRIRRRETRFLGGGNGSP